MCISTALKKEESKEQRERTNKKMFFKLSKRKVAFSSALFVHFKKQITFQFLFSQLGQQLLHQTKCNGLLSTKCLQRTPSSSTTPNPKAHKKKWKTFSSYLLKHTKLQIKLTTKHITFHARYSSCRSATWVLQCWGLHYKEHVQGKDNNYNSQTLWKHSKQLRKGADSPSSPC